MAKRIKSDKPALISIKDWAHADELIREIADHQICIETVSYTHLTLPTTPYV